MIAVGARAFVQLAARCGRGGAELDGREGDRIGQGIEHVVTRKGRGSPRVVRRRESPAWPRPAHVGELVGGRGGTIHRGQRLAALWRGRRRGGPAAILSHSNRPSFALARKNLHRALRGLLGESGWLGRWLFCPKACSDQRALAHIDGRGLHVKLLHFAFELL